VLVLSALQQVALMSNTLVYPIILGRAAGLSLAVLGVRYSLGLQADNSIEPRALMVAAIVLITMVGLNVWTKAPLVISEQRPSPRTIMASEDGERLLAGYLLRRSADRISSRMSGDRAEIHLHYDH
jgi:hypothetical protein